MTERRPVSLRSSSGAALAALAASGVACVLYATAHGAGVSPDSVAYVGAAENLGRGRGLSLPYGSITDTPLTHYPPLYPAALVALGVFGVDARDAVRLLGAGLFGIFIFSSGLALRRIVTASEWLAIVFTAFVAFAPPVLSVYTMAWSETVFLPLWLLALCAMRAALRNPSASVVGFAGLASGLAVLSRYAGLSLVMTGAVAMLVLQRGGAARRLRSAAWFSASAMILPAVWFADRMQSAGNGTGRSLVFHPAGAEHVRQALTTVASWLLVPQTAGGMVKLCAVLLCAGAIAYAVRHGMRSAHPEPSNARGDWTLAFLLTLFAGVYCAFVVASISLADANTPLDDRILLPVFVAGSMIAAFALGVAVQSAARPRRFASIAAILLLGVIVMRASDTARFVADAHANGQGFESTRWQGSVLIERVKALPPQVLVYTNSPAGVYFLSDRRAVPLPLSRNAVTGVANAGFQDDVARMEAEVTDGRAVIVWLKANGAGHGAALGDMSRLAPPGSRVFAAREGALIDSGRAGAAIGGAIPR